MKQYILDLFYQFGLCEGYKGVYRHLETVAEQAKISLLLFDIDIN